MIELQADWYQENKNKINKKNKKRYQNEEIYRLKNIMRKKMTYILSDKCADTFYPKELNCTNDIFRKWIKFCFTKKNEFGQ